MEEDIALAEIVSIPARMPMMTNMMSKGEQSILCITKIERRFQRNIGFLEARLGALFRLLRSASKQEKKVVTANSRVKLM